MKDYLEALKYDGILGEHLWIQWKGTDVCCDIQCKCGAHLHFDGGFFYEFICGSCGRKYATGAHVRIYELDEVSERTPTLIEDQE